jgi:hypothetical protein
MDMASSNRFTLEESRRLACICSISSPVHSKDITNLLYILENSTKVNVPLYHCMRSGGVALQFLALCADKWPDSRLYCSTSPRKRTMAAIMYNVWLAPGLVWVLLSKDSSPVPA